MSLRTVFLGSDPRQQLRASQALLALAVYLCFAAVQHGEVLMGLIDEAASWPLTAWNLSGGLGFYLLIRSGLNDVLVEPRRAALIPGFAEVKQAALAHEERRQVAVAAQERKADRAVQHGDRHQVKARQHCLAVTDLVLRLDA
mgnify:CR=1 FL=1